MPKTKKNKKIFHSLLVVWLLWYLPMFAPIPLFRGKYINIICGIGMAVTIIGILYVLYRMQDVWEEDRKETIMQTDKYLFEKYFGDIRCAEGEISSSEREQNIIYDGRDIKILYEVTGKLNNLKFTYRGIFVQKTERSREWEPNSKKITRYYFKGNAFKWTDSMLHGTNDMIFFTDAMEGIMQTYPKSYGYEKIDVFPNKSVLYSKGTPFADTVKRLCNIYEMADKCFMDVSQRNEPANMAIFVKNSDIEIFIYDSKIKEIDIMKGIHFFTEMIGNL